TDNVALVASTVVPAVPMADEPISVSVLVTNTGPDATQVTLALTGAGAATPPMTVTLPSYAMAAPNSANSIGGPPRVEVQFETVAPTVGRHKLTVSLVNHADAMPWDDRIGVRLSVVDRRLVSLVSRAKSDDASTGTYYMARALAAGIHGSLERVHLIEPG